MNRQNWCFTNVRTVLMNVNERDSLYSLLSYSLYHPTADKIKERIASYQSPDIHIYACAEDSIYLGIIVYRLCDRTAEIMDIAVHERTRSCGVGSFLIDGLLRESNATCVLAETDDDAIDFYQKYGFRVTNTETVFNRKRYRCRYIPLEIKTIKRDNWSRVLSRSFRFAEKTCGDFNCVVGLLTIGDVISPLKKTMFGKELILADKGYHWLQIAPEGESWWLTVMINPDGNIVQYYYDITDRNILDGEHSRFYDLYLDVVLLPDGNATVLDQDELDTALANDVITESQYQKAMDMANRLYRDVPPSLEDLEEFVMAVYRDVQEEC